MLAVWSAGKWAKQGQAGPSRAKQGQAGPCRAMQGHAQPSQSEAGRTGAKPGCQGARHAHGFSLSSGVCVSRMSISEKRKGSAGRKKECPRRKSFRPADDPDLAALICWSVSVGRWEMGDGRSKMGHGRWEMVRNGGKWREMEGNLQRAMDPQPLLCCS